MGMFKDFITQGKKLDAGQHFDLLSVTSRIETSTGSAGLIIKLGSGDRFFIYDKLGFLCWTASIEALAILLSAQQDSPTGARDLIEHPPREPSEDELLAEMLEMQEKSDASFGDNFNYYRSIDTLEIKNIRVEDDPRLEAMRRRASDLAAAARDKIGHVPMPGQDIREDRTLSTGDGGISADDTSVPWQSKASDAAIV